jgi:branched-chain amino acid transport system substrate-binding protein
MEQRNLRMVGAALAVALLGASGAAHAQVSDDVVKIGVLNDQSGLFADLAGPGSVEAARMAVADFGGTVLGKPIEVIAGDHQNKPDVGAALARQWYDVDKVDVILDIPNSGVALAVQQVTKDKNKLVIFSSAAVSDLTGKACSPNGVHWAFDSYALAHSTGSAVVKQGGDSWFFLTVDYALGHTLERDTAEVVKASGGKIVGSVKHPLNTADFSSFVLQAQQSKAKVVAFANAGGDLSNSIKQAQEFGLFQAGQKPVGIMVFLTDVHSLGLQAAQGLQLTASFYWDMNDETRAWSKRFFEKVKRMPTMPQAGVYTSVLHYLNAIKAAGTDESMAVVKKMRETPINDFMTKNGRLREDGRVLRDFYLFEVKKPSESKGPWDYYKLVTTVPAEQAARPLSESDCPLVKKQ